MCATRPANSHDTWFHHIISGDGFKSQHPRVRPRYLQNQIDPVANDPAKGWEAEISGRLLSIAANIAKFAEGAANAAGGPPNLRFRAAAFATVAAIRAGGFEVHEDPIPGDDAHAVFTIAHLEFAPGSSDSKQVIKHELLLSIAGLLQLCVKREISSP